VAQQQAACQHSNMVVRGVDCSSHMPLNRTATASLRLLCVRAVSRSHKISVRAVSTSILPVGMGGQRILGYFLPILEAALIFVHVCQVLRVLNDDLVKPRAGFGSHPHRDMVRSQTLVMHMFFA
jgi:hypothetical protein